MALCKDVFAEPMLENDETFLEEYVEKLKELQNQGVLPSDLEKEIPYKVYSVEGSSCGPHRSIVISSDDKRFFTIELGFTEVDGVRRIYPVTREIDPSLKPKFTSHGTVTMSTSNLLGCGVAVLKKFGSYFKFCNNCQDYCNHYLESIGLGKTKKMTDVERTSLIAVAVGLCTTVLMLLFKK